ncbi:helix-turn-helix domain-containing protein [Thiocapsa roseopersicina]|uniref:Transposase n=1 Tax=Thiocapsa roseopersicina TaxID=1058 RepID=A0A1H3DRV6_THIRO|nr:helix-turn-helix domain-containing protein [Thiocapsa roseopersicina]SDX69145.1 Transposase [Thiocapsa roseopersicina]
MTEPVNLMTGLTDQQTRAARLLAEGRAAVEVAQAVGVDESTISRWRRKAPFGALVQAFHAKANIEVMGRMTDLTNRALDVLDSLLTNSSNHSVRLRAAVAILSASGISRQIRGSMPNGSLDVTGVDSSVGDFASK